MFAQPGDPFCPVALYKAYADKRPETACQRDSRFYLSVNPHYGSRPGWFINLGMGKNTLGQLAKRMSEKAEFTARHVNHSARKTCITKLLDAQTPPIEVAQISGHKNLLSLNHYNTVSLDKQIHMSTVLHGSTSATSTVTSSSVLSNRPTNSGDNQQGTVEELFNASQEIEQAIQRISQYENGNDHLEQVIDLPIVHSPSGRIQLTKDNFRPESLFQNCVFNQSVTFNFK